jgi:hypothetical protein
METPLVWALIGTSCLLGDKVRNKRRIRGQRGTAGCGNLRRTVGSRCHHQPVTLPPTVDEAIRLIRRQNGTVTVGDLADAVIARGWNVDRAALVARIRELFPERAAEQALRAGTRRPKSAASKSKATPRSGQPVGRKKRPKAKVTQDYCPRCHVFVVMTRLSGVTTVADHLTKKGARCTMSGKAFTPKKPAKRDAMEFRVAGSFGTGKRR